MKSWVGGWCFSCVVRGSLVVRSGVDGVVVVGVSDHLAHSTLADDARVTAPAARDQIVAAQLTARSLARSLVRDKSRTAVLKASESCTFTTHHTDSALPSQLARQTQTRVGLLSIDPDEAYLVPTKSQKKRS